MAEPRLTIPTRRNIADRAHILRLVLAAGLGGLRAAVLMIEVKRSAQCVGSHLVALEGAGLIERSNSTGNGCKWGQPGTWAHHQGDRDRNAARREARAARSHQVRRPRATARRLPPNSVWALADLCHG